MSRHQQPGLGDILRRLSHSKKGKRKPNPLLPLPCSGHGLRVNLDVYTVAGLDQRLAAVNLLEQSLVSTAIN